MRCPYCGAEWTMCPECSRDYKHGDYAFCQNEHHWVEGLVPLQCGNCNRDVLYTNDGVVDFDGTWKDYKEE